VAHPCDLCEQFFHERAQAMERNLNGLWPKMAHLFASAHRECNILLRQFDTDRRALAGKYFMLFCL
jgi:hypothetical protein